MFKGKDGDSASGPGERYVKEPPLFCEREGLWQEHGALQNWVVFDFAGESLAATSEVQDQNVVRFGTLATVNG